MTLFQAKARLIDPAGLGVLTFGTGPGNAPTVTLPIISTTPVAPQCAVDSIVLVRSDPIYGGIVMDANQNGAIIDRYTELGMGAYLATASLIWRKLPPGNISATLLKTVAPAPGGVIVAFPANQAIAAIKTPGQIAGWIPVLLDDLSIGWQPYWQ